MKATLLKTACIVFVLCLFFSFDAKAQLFSGGSGTVNAPYQISKLADLNELSTRIQNQSVNMKAYYILTTNIDLGGSATPFAPIGVSGTNTMAFQGTFDGQGYTIKNLYNNNTINEYKGFFGLLANAVVKNLIIQNVTIISGSKTGGLAGGSSGSQVVNCAVIGGNISEGSLTGGLIGRIMYDSPSKVLNCFATVNVKAKQDVGGLIGNMENGILLNSYATGSVTVTKNVMGSKAGGLVGVVGYDVTSVTNCYATGNIVADSSNGKIGGLAGEVNAPSYLTIEAYWNNSATQTVQGSNQNPKKGIGDSFGSWTNLTVAKTATELKAAAFLTLLNTKKSAIAELVASIAASGWIADAGNKNQGYPVLASNNPIGIAGVSQIEALLYPNPVQSHLFVQTKEPLQYYELYNLQGICVQMGKTNQNQVRINMQNLPAGIYMLTIATTQGKVTKKIIKK